MFNPLTCRCVLLYGAKDLNTSKQNTKGLQVFCWCEKSEQNTKRSASFCWCDKQAKHKKFFVDVKKASKTQKGVQVFFCWCEKQAKHKKECNYKKRASPLPTHSQINCYFQLMFNWCSIDFQLMLGGWFDKVWKIGRLVVWVWAVQDINDMSRGNLSP